MTRNSANDYDGQRIGREMSVGSVHIRQIFLQLLQGFHVAPIIPLLKTTADVQGQPAKFQPARLFGLLVKIVKSNFLPIPHAARSGAIFCMRSRPF